MHLPGATQPGSKHHQIAGPEPHRLTALGRDADITLQQQAGLLLVVGPREGAYPTAPGVPGVNYLGGSRQLRRRVPPLSPPAMAGGGDSEN